MKFLYLPLLAVWIVGPKLTIAQDISNNGPKIGEGTTHSDLNKTLSHSFTFVIDAGHGGKDGGCSAKDTKEKEITLSVAKMLKKEINDHLPQVKVVMTRDKDVFVPLHKRADIANKSRADLFLSIHCNAIVNRSDVNGTESYVMGLHTAAENLQVAKRENASILLESNQDKHYYGFDPNSTEGHIMMEMFQNIHLDQSLAYADLIESVIRASNVYKSRGVKQAGFVVLRQTAMPSVLFESGYLTSKKDRSFLRTKKGQKFMAESLFEAFKQYIEIYPGRPIATDVIAQVAEEEAPLKPEVSDVPEPKKQTAFIQQSEPVAVAKPVKNEVDGAPEKKAASPADNVNMNVKPMANLNYMVQLGVYSKKINTGDAPWSEVPRLIYMEAGEMFKYFSDGYITEKDATDAKITLRINGFPDAFIVAYVNGKKVSLEEARKYVSLAQN